VKEIVERLRRVRVVEKERKFIKQQLEAGHSFMGIVSMNAEMEHIFGIIRRVALEECTVLIQGESGTGKELIARAIHECSGRAERPFVTVDCGAVHKQLIESELFGHRRGAFTGAYVSKEGLFVRARGGSLFLDEIAEIPVEVQPTLLRAIEEKKIRPVGGTEAVAVDVRIIAATNRNLEEEMKAGRFRQDLFFRLNVVTINVPPLRQRKEDIPLLVWHFIDKFGRTSRRRINRVEHEAMVALQRYDWPGNVRELENTISQAFAIGSGEVLRLDEMPHSILSSARAKGRLSFSAPRSLQEMEKETIISALAEHRGNTKEAAKTLGIDRSTLYRKIARYGIDLKEFRS
jgi:two-component system response regulator HydG